MNQEKTGRFILKLRKEKNMTQAELAYRLGITDRAISKWENGRGMPDLSLLLPLCDALDISVNELLSGERLDDGNFIEKSEENIINTIDYTNKTIKKTKRLFIFILSAILIAVTLFTTMFSVDVNRMRNNRPVVFSTWGYCYTPAVDIKEPEIELAITNYLTEKGDNEPGHHAGEKTFAAMRVYLLEEKERDKLYTVYAWVLTGKFYSENGEIKEDSGYSIPHSFTVESIDGKFTVTDSIIPRDGTFYPDDMKNIFPDSVRRDMNNVHTDGTIERLQSEITQQANLYFRK